MATKSRFKFWRVLRSSLDFHVQPYFHIFNCPNLNQNSSSNVSWHLSEFVNIHVKHWNNFLFTFCRNFIWLAAPLRKKSPLFVIATWCCFSLNFLVKPQCFAEIGRDDIWSEAFFTEAFLLLFVVKAIRSSFFWLNEKIGFLSV